MPANKNQHFVPKMYLKLFGNVPVASIGVFNIAAERFIPMASIRDQASKAWFYDRDGQVEHTFGAIESRAARLLDQILQHDRLPQRFGAAHHGLLTFVSLQHERTQAAVAEFNERTDKYVKAMLRHQYAGHEMVENLHLVEISRSDAVAESLLAAHLSMPLLYDLKYKLVENVSGRAFFISDAPVIFHNHLYGGTGASADGYANVGLQILVPIGPWRAILFYDDVAYAVGSPASSIARLVNPADAMRINDLQWEAADKNLYVSPETDVDELHERCRHWKTKRESGRIMLTDTVVRDDHLEKRVRLGVGRQPSNVDLDLPFIRTALPKPGLWTEEKHTPLRDPEWAHFVTSLAEMVQDEQLDYREFVRRTIVAPRARGHRKRTAKAVSRGKT